MKKIVITLFAVLSIIITAKAYTNEEAYGFVKIPEFNKVKVNTQSIVSVIHSDSFSILIKGQDTTNCVDYKVKDGLLEIVNRRNEDADNKIRIIITTPNDNAPQIKTGDCFVVKDIKRKA